MAKIITDKLQPLGLTEADIRDPFLRTLQAVHDQVFVDPLLANNLKTKEGFRLAKTIQAGRQIGVALGKVIALDHGERGSADATRYFGFPDILMSRTQLANTLGYDLGRREGAKTTTGDTLLEAKDLITEARVKIDEYTDLVCRGVHGATYVKKIKEQAIPPLHEAGLILGNFFSEDPHDVHAERIVGKLWMTTPIQRPLF